MVPIVATLNRVPGGTMLIPLLLGSIVRTFAPGFLELGSFTSALFRDSALPLIALLVLATGAQLNLRQSGRVLAKAGTLVLFKTFLPALLAIAYGYLFGLDGILGISLLAFMVAFINSNGGLWIALASQYGDEEDRGAYIASALNDGPFFTLLFLGLSGLGAIPWQALVAAIVPFIIGFILGNLDERFAKMMEPTASITIPFFAFALGAGIDLRSLAVGGATGLILGVLVSVVTGYLGVLGYRLLLGERSAVGFAVGTTAGNAVVTPAIVAQADPRFAPFVEVAAAQIAAAVLVTAILTPLLTHYFHQRWSGQRPAPSGARV
ncbi:MULTISPECIES: 2-keto-3-deoxygluconate permease [Limnochorda]|uniref:2-keto-3-deoxygluconate permease n=1 Tax=Limnochorda TaxID=1676651 RepID=UPI0017B5CBF4|nr:2-keto-3-deoxygluconate permease [Limnochorda pilosa]MBO2518567.1 2-keto-3-deoxygluconate permease [Bacillota bacterium]NMA72373.1 2-keto-3-deoxygluconate permease [Bacillota bacterium]